MKLWQFTDALFDSDMRIRIKQSRPKTLNDAVSPAVELEAYIKSDRRNQETKEFARPLTNSVPTENSLEGQILNRA